MSESFSLDADAFRLALEGSNIALWDWHIPSGRVAFNERWAEMIGYTLTELSPISIQTWLSLAHPDDLGVSEAALNAHFSGQKAYYEIEIRMRHKEGHSIWVLDRGLVIEWDDDGKPLRMVGTHQDISHQHELVDSVMQNELRLRTLITNLRAGVLLEDASRKIVLTNQGFLNLFGLPGTPDDKIGFDCSMAATLTAQQFINPKQFIANIDQILSARKTVEGQELQMVNGRTLSRDFVPIDYQNQALGLLWIYRDITDIKQKENLLRQLSETDALTNVANRRAFMEQLQSRMAQENRSSKLFLAIIDVDHFKKINDHYGHLVGDAVLKYLATALNENLRATDLLGRIGGEEFAVLLESNDLGNVQKILDHTRESIASQEFDYNNHFIAITISIGLTQITPLDALNGILSRADKAMYQAKNAGRNRLVSLMS